MAQGSLLQEQLRQSRRAGEPIKAWGRLGETAIGAVTEYYKQKYKIATAKRKEAKTAYEKSLRAPTDRKRTEDIGRLRDSISTGKFKYFTGKTELEVDVNSIESADRVAGFLKIRQDPRVKELFKGLTHDPGKPGFPARPERPVVAPTTRKLKGWKGFITPRIQVPGAPALPARAAIPGRAPGFKYAKPGVRKKAKDPLDIFKDR